MDELHILLTDICLEIQLYDLEIRAIRTQQQFLFKSYAFLVVVSMPLPEIWKAILPEGQRIVLARADDVDQAQTQVYPEILMEH